MTDLSQLFMYIPGIIVFLVGSGQVRRWIRMNRGGFCADAAVTDCRHVVKKDKKGREVYNYYQVSVEYKNPQTKHTERQNVKSPTEYALGQQVRMCRDKGSTAMTLSENKDEFPLHPLVFMAVGALLILLALKENQGKEVQAMACLSLVLLGAGANLIVNYIWLKRRNLKVICGEIIEIYERQISRETKILRGSKFTYYPVVKYELDGKENIRCCNINSSGKNTFRTGEHRKLYYDPKTKEVLEKHARIGIMVAGILLTLVGVLTGASILSALL